MDNYYTSVGLFEELEGRKTLACGTVRSNRLGLPKDSVLGTVPTSEDDSGTS